MRSLSLILLSLTIQLHATDLMELGDIYRLSTKSDASSINSLYTNLHQHSQKLIKSGKVDEDFLDLLYALRTMPKEGHLLNECEAILSQRGFIFRLLTKHTGYDKIYFAQKQPSVLFNSDEHYQQSLIRWYIDEYTSDRKIRTFKP